MSAALPSMVIISNRLPVSIATDGAEGPRLVRSSGGLATALREVHDSGGLGHWVGWLGDTSRVGAEAAARLHEQALAQRLTPVPLSAGEVARYYDGYSNGVLWPLFHYLLDKVRLEAGSEWRTYVQVNQRFAEATAARVRPGDTVWVHDYQLTLVPALLRKLVPSLRIGFFLHVPWPSSDVFRILPSRVEVLRGLLGADLIGFQTDGYRQNFLQSAAEVLGIDFGTDRILWEERQVRVGVYPIGIDLQSFSVQKSEIDVQVEEIRRSTAGKKIVLGVDRLDYTKGLPRRLLAIEMLLEREPLLRQKLHYIQLAVPTREKVDAYAKLRRDVNERVARINSLHGSPTTSPVQLLYRTLPFDQLIALYRAADVMLVTPLRDGMNLVAKEYVASRPEGGGVLILSEFAGAASELATAIAVNPYDVSGLGAAIRRAMFMPEEEQRVRMSRLQSAVRGQPVQKWARDFLDDLREMTPSMMPDNSLPSELEAAIERVRSARHRTLLLDYDGTLVPIVELPSLAVPDAHLIDLLKSLANSSNTALHVVTGRSQETMEPWLGELPIWLHVEHGLRSRRPDGTWLDATFERPKEFDTIFAIMQKYAARTYGALVEPKAASVAFHYRRANPIVAHESLAALRAELGSSLSAEVQLLEGHKVLEVRVKGVNKRSAVELALKEAPSDTLALAVGDDRTDEDMFAALPDDAISIRVGKGPSAAKLRIADPTDLRHLLAEFARP